MTIVITRDIDIGIRCESAFIDVIDAIIVIEFEA